MERKQQKIKITRIPSDRSVVAYILGNRVGSDRVGIERMLPKAGKVSYLIEGLTSYEANILKQEALSVGADLAISRGAILKNRQNETVLLLATEKQISRLLEKLSEQKFSGFRSLLDAFESLNRPMVWRFKDRQIELSRPIIMGILNLTPDSFSGDGIVDIKSAVDRAGRMLKEGADIIDLGGESTRPGATKVDEKEEVARLIPVLEAVRKRFPKAVISVDTYKPGTAEIACKKGADIVNDVSGLRCPAMCSVVKKYRVGVVIMHMKGSPRNMQIRPLEGDTVGIVLEALKRRVFRAIAHGIDEDRIVVDPGIGFGKTWQDNYRLIAFTSLFSSIRPVLVGVSRKSLIDAIDKSKPRERVAGTVALNLFALSRGASIFRVHDVREHKQAFRVWQEIERHL